MGKVAAQPLRHLLLKIVALQSKIVKSLRQLRNKLQDTETVIVGIAQRFDFVDTSVLGCLNPCP